jgi:dissimilatory sulfite reductase (desulfoviridin) alpha/beta subunit
VNTQQE